jgi:predicted acylesterase/phospholipase RssA
VCEFENYTCFRSIVEAGIPIDRVGGVSIGAYMGSLWSAHRDLALMTSRCREWFWNMCRYAGLLDLTYPITSLFAGNYFNWTLRETFGEELNIEDLWLPFYCVSTDVTLSRERVHVSGIPLASQMKVGIAILKKIIDTGTGNQSCGSEIISSRMRKIQ